MIDWKALFSDMGVDWRDRGPNTTQNDVNICCPFCGDDYGYHLGVDIERGSGYYCFRNPEHGGRSPIHLLRALGATNEEAKSLVTEYGNGEAPVVRTSAAPDDLTRRWREFRSAAEQPDIMDYMRDRGFSDPKHVARKYDLRWETGGKWAGRVILPVKLDGKIVSWTARALAPERRPKYLMQSVVFPGLIYMPRISTDTMVIQEGPIDALKVCASEMDHVGALALMGKALNSRKLIILTKLLKDVRKVIFSPDGDVDNVQAERMRKLISLARMGKPPIPLLKHPDGYKDAGEMPMNVIRRWVHTV